MKFFSLFALIATVSAFEISSDCPENKTLGYFGNCSESCLSLLLPPEFCTLKLNHGCMCKEGYVLQQDQAFFSPCIKPEDCPDSPFKELPDSPLDLKVQEVGRGSVNVSWSQTYSRNENPITAYVLNYRRDTASGIPRVWEKKALIGNQTSVLIENLNPGTNYRLYIVAVNAEYRSEPSDLISFTTNEEEPSAPLTDVNVTVKGETLFVIWKSPPETQMKGFYVGYNRTRNFSPPHAFKSEDHVPGAVQEYMITSFRNDSEYSISVKALNNPRTGPTFQDIVIRTSEADVPTTPLELKVQDVWNNKARVSWLVPHTGYSPNTKYVLQYWKSTAPGQRVHFQEKVVSSARRSALIEDLYSATNYSISIFAENDAEKSEPSYSISFTTSENFPNAPPKDVKVEVKGTATLVVTWKPPPKYEWNGKLRGFYVGYKEKRDFSRYSFKTSDYMPDVVQECTITHLRENTEYSIMVQAFNNVGSGPQSYDVTIRTLGRELPATPLDLKVLEVLDRTAKISWSFPQTGNHSDIKFVVQYWRYTETGSRFHLKEDVVSSGETSFLIKHLRPGTNYGLAIAAENEVGQSEPSDTVLFATSEEEPSAPPTDINIEVNGTTSLLVTWKPPPKYEWNGEIKGFFVGYKRLSDSRRPYAFKLVDYVPGGIQEYVITDLLKNTEYSIIVKAFNKAGTGPSSSDLVIRTLGEDAPVTPLDLKVKEVWSRSVRVSWSSPHTGNTSNTKYVLQYWKDGAIGGRYLSGEKVVNSGQMSALIKDLHPATNYYVAIVAENDVGRSKPSETVSFTTNEEEPSASPRDVKAEAKGMTSLLVTWKAPRKSEWNGKLRGFYVGYKNMQDSRQFYSFKTVGYVRGELQEFMITNLRADTEYSVIVKAFNNVGTGPPSIPVTIRTLGESAMMNEI